MDFDVDHHRKLIKIRLFGDLSPDALREAASQVFSQYPGYSRLWDLRSASIGDLSRDQLEGLAKFSQRGDSQPGKVRSALLVARDLDFGVGRMYQMVGEQILPVNFAVFRDEDEADGWFSETDDGGGDEPGSQ